MGLDRSGGACILLPLFVIGVVTSGSFIINNRQFILFLAIRSRYASIVILALHQTAGTIAPKASALGRRRVAAGGYQSQTQAGFRRLQFAARYAAHFVCFLWLCHSPVHLRILKNLLSMVPAWERLYGKYRTMEILYAGAEQEFLLSLRLLGRTDREDGGLACLYAVSNHIEKHYHPAEIRKRDGSIRRLLVPDPL